MLSSSLGASHRDLVVFGEDWGGLPSSTQHLIGHLATERRVLWVNSIGLRQPRLGWHDLSRVCTKLCRALSRAPQAHTTRPAFPVLNPVAVPAPRSQPVRRLSRALLARQLLPALQQHGLKDPILWLSLPTAVDVAGQLGEHALVYYCGDDFGALAGVDHATVLQRESELVQRAQLVLAASEPLAERLQHGRTRLLPHGVSFDLFSQPAPRADDLPNDGRPIAGFYGSLSEWLDIDLLRAVAQRLPEWHFLFIGAAVVDLTPLTRLPNVRLLGKRPHSTLPGYSQHWSASLLPFRDNAQIRACNPLKLKEYLATGRPVVSTPFPALAPYRHLVQPVRTPDEMVAALRASQHTAHSPTQVQAVAGSDWSVQAQQVSRWLDQL